MKIGRAKKEEGRICPQRGRVWEESQKASLHSSGTAGKRSVLIEECLRGGDHDYWYRYPQKKRTQSKRTSKDIKGDLDHKGRYVCLGGEDSNRGERA